ncbi:MAG: relaxase [Rhodospirillaceae bacterium]|nr:relaxase [Rhodospirillaceae bacterium]
MIIKASQRGGGKALALHLLKTEENEHVEVHEVRGFVSDDIVGAMKEAYAVSRGTRCKQFLFSVSLNPPETERVGVHVFEAVADRIEKKTGLEGQPRIIVFHEKEGRRHAHVVWSRIDVDSMTAVNMSHFKTKLRDISRETYLEHDWRMPKGLMNSEARDPRNFTLAEWQQAKRMGENARDLKAMMQECWAVSDSRAAFEQALGERGIVLAKGDRRGHVAVTHQGEVLSVARCTDKKAKEVRAKLGEPDTLPSVDQAKASMAQDMTRAFNRHVDEARAKHAAETIQLQLRRREMTASHAAERQRLDATQKDRWVRETRERQERFNKGFRGLWDRVTGQHARLRKQNELEAYAALRRDREQRDALVSAQLEERQQLQVRLHEGRQRQAELLHDLRRDRSQLREAFGPPAEKKPPEKAPAGPARPAAEQTPERPPAPEPRPQAEAERPPVPDHLERLAALREAPAGAAAQPTKEPEQERDAASRLQKFREQRSADQGHSIFPERHQ